MSNNLKNEIDKLLISAEQCRGARGMLGWSQHELAEAASLSRATIADFERGERTPIMNNLVALRAALEEAGIEFIPENGGGVGLRFRQPGSARPSKAQQNPVRRS